MKLLKLIFISLLFISFAQAQTANIDSTAAIANVKASAQKMGQSFIDKNYNEYIKYVHPKVIKLAGGNDGMIELLKKSLKQTEEQGYTFKNVSIGEPLKIITSSTEMQCIIPQILELKTRTGRIVSTAYLLGISTDKGKIWHFTDTGGKTLAQMKTLFPTLSNQLDIPKKAEPVFYHD